MVARRPSPLLELQTFCLSSHLAIAQLCSSYNVILVYICLLLCSISKDAELETLAVGLCFFYLVWLFVPLLVLFGVGKSLNILPSGVEIKSEIGE